MDGAQVGVLKESNQVGFSSFLHGQDGRRLESPTDRAHKQHTRRSIMSAE
jgi:hypothetical protein